MTVLKKLAARRALLVRPRPDYPQVPDAAGPGEPCPGELFGALFPGMFSVATGLRPQAGGSRR